MLFTGFVGASALTALVFVGASALTALVLVLSFARMFGYNSPDLITSILFQGLVALLSSSCLLSIVGSIVIVVNPLLKLDESNVRASLRFGLWFIVIVFPPLAMFLLISAIPLLLLPFTVPVAIFSLFLTGFLILWTALALDRENKSHRAQKQSDKTE